MIWKNVLSTMIQPRLQSSPLGRWISKTHQIWPATASYSNKFVHYYDQFYEITKVSRRSNYALTSKTAECQLAVDVIPTANGLQLVDVGSTYSLPPPPIRLNTAWQFYNNAAKWQKKNWGLAPITEDILSTIADELQNNNLSCAGDGSVLFGRAAHAWCIFRKSDFFIVISGSADVYGGYRDTNFIRPESFGCIAALSLLHLVASSIETTLASVTYYVDNDTTVKSSERTFIHDVARLFGKRHRYNDRNKSHYKKIKNKHESRARPWSSGH